MATVPAAVLLGWCLGMAVVPVPQSRTQAGGLGQLGVGGDQFIGAEPPSLLSLKEAF